MGESEKLVLQYQAELQYGGDCSPELVPECERR
jgi:hypothetical protein